MKALKKMTEQERVRRALQGCLAYSEGKMTLRQVWYRVRGDRNREYFRNLEDNTLRQELYGLSMDFFACYGYDNELLDERIRTIAAYLRRLRRSKLERERPNMLRASA